MRLPSLSRQVWRLQFRHARVPSSAIPFVITATQTYNRAYSPQTTACVPQCRQHATFKRYTMDQESLGRLASQPKDGLLFKNRDEEEHLDGPRKHVAYIALGSNLGDRVAMIEQACREMNARGIRVKKTSSLWETEPMYVLNQDRFLNGACEVETELEPLDLLDALQNIEKSMGRQKIIDKGPRNIDLDILLYGEGRHAQTVSHGRLQIPHPLITEREFVLRPLAELIPQHALDASRPWKLIQDHLNELPSPEGQYEPLSTLTPLRKSSLPLHPLQSARKTQVMAILNVTPDSFSDGGVHLPQSIGSETQDALVLSHEYLDSLKEKILRFINSGATIIDVGGQSTAPGASEVTAEEELARILPAISLIRKLPEASHTSISVDTYRANVAEAAVMAGADIVNDVSAGALDSAMLSTVARLGCTICLMHMRGTPANMSSLNEYPDGLITGLAEELRERVRAAEDAGIPRWRIILDPGLGFAKVGGQNVEVLRFMSELRLWPGLKGLPWLLGPSRKSFVGKITGVARAQDRVLGTAAAVVASVQGGADIVRVHDVPEMVQVVKMADAIYRY